MAAGSTKLLNPASRSRLICIGRISFIGLFITLGVIVLYIMGNASVVRLFLTRYRSEFNWFKHAFVPLLASAILVVGLYYSLIPWPAWPLNLAVVIVACWLVLGVVLAFALGRTKREALDRAAELMFTADDDAPPPATTPAFGPLPTDGAPV